MDQTLECLENCKDGYQYIEKLSRDMLLCRNKEDDLQCNNLRNTLLEVTKKAVDLIGNNTNQRNELLGEQRRLFHDLEKISRKKDVVDWYTIHEEDEIYEN
jgi:hypothetical protein